MDQQTFIEKALKTEYEPEKLPLSKVGLTAALDLAITCSEIIDQVKKLIIYGKPIDTAKMNSQLWGMGDAGYALDQEVRKPNGKTVSNDEINIRLLHAAIGMFTETGELLEAMKKQLETGELDRVNFGEELGDTRWYEAIALDELGADAEKIMETVIIKLAIRYPEKFTQSAALNRNLDAERAVLEAGIGNC